MENERVARNKGGASQQAHCASALLTLFWLFMVSAVSAQESDRSRLYEPLFRVSKKASASGKSNLSGNVAIPVAPAGAVAEAPVDAVAEAPVAHPLDSALATARHALENIEQSVQDYTCTLVKRVRVHGELLDYQFIACKVRHARADGAEVVPFGVYLRFLKPDGVRGREVIYVDGRNDGKLVAHEGGFKGRFLPTVNLMPTSALAMRGCRYPITEIGVMTLTRRLIEKGDRDRKQGECEVRRVDGAEVCARVCTMLEVKHEVRKPQLDFHLARIFVDRELNVPIRYEAYGWPTQSGASPPLLEEYTYMDLKLNVGLTDSDFDAKNSKYHF